MSNAETPTIELGSETVADLLTSLRSDVCPMCGGHKPSLKSICGRCWFNLPKPFRLPLYRQIRQGYQEAFRRAPAGHGGLPNGDAAPTRGDP